MPPEQNSPTLKWRSTGEFYFGTFGEYSPGTDTRLCPKYAPGAEHFRTLNLSIRGHGWFAFWLVTALRYDLALILTFSSW